MAEEHGVKPSAAGGTPNGTTFEQAMERLEAIVAKLESGDVPLETAIELFQEGMSLSRLCGQKLEQVERRIEMLVEGESGGLGRKPFAPSREEGNGD
ncbi:exodeoxyribonuclease VII small subunit [Cohnella sp. CFH 77786]|uniref:exodeoxyribonuclease VII small subunit n=1 Tax=Cohnella sp. CFH 77786 TaxID=2662265 RepID=UPI001C60AFC1|nr:exodeoxyribonuclease VII small subunit [Cohnella sp. CFH 77786]MBW5446768.1 exodeoxyribonuclease VII small subunit [Cohnella sp. CFH 77786]